MTEPTPKKVKAFVIRKFKDAGTPVRSFAANEIVEIDEGDFANYEEAQLVRKATADDTKAAKDPKDAGKTDA